MQVRTAGALGIVAMILASLALVLVLFGNENTTSTESDDTSSIFDDSVGTKFSIASANDPDTEGLTELSNRITGVELEIKGIKNKMRRIDDFATEIREMHDNIQQIRPDLEEAVNNANQAREDYTEASDLLIAASNRLPDGFLTDIDVRGTIRCTWGLISEDMFRDSGTFFQWYRQPDPSRHTCQESDFSSFNQAGNFDTTPAAAVLDNIDMSCLAGPSASELRHRNEPACGENLLSELRDPESSTDASIFWSRAIIAIPLGDKLIRPNRDGGRELLPNISNCSTEIEGTWTARSRERLDYFYSLPLGRTEPREAYYSSANTSIIGKSWLGEGILSPSFDRGLDVRTWVDRKGTGIIFDRLTSDIFSKSLIISIAPQVDWNFVQLQNMDIPISLQLDYKLTITCTQTL